MKLITHQKVTMENMNHHGSMEGKCLMSWMSDSAYMGIAQTLGRTDHIVMCSVKEITFDNPVLLGAIIAIRYKLVKAGRTSLTIAVEARDMLNPELLYGSCQVVYVTVGDDGKSVPHGIILSE